MTSARQPAAHMSLPHQELDRRFKRGVGEVGEGLRRLRRTPGTAGFGNGSKQRDTTLGAAERGRERRFVRGGAAIHRNV